MRSGLDRPLRWVHDADGVIRAGHRSRAASAALVALAAELVVSACSSSPGVVDCGSGYVRVTGAAAHDLASCAGLVGIRIPPLRLDRDKSVRIVVDSRSTVTLAADGAGVVSIDGLKITARRAGTAVITQTGLACTNQAHRCRLVQVIVR